MRLSWTLVFAVLAAAVIGWRAPSFFWPNGETGKKEAPGLTWEQKEDFAEIIRYNSLLCAQVVEAQKREGRTYYIECETHPDKLARRGYYLDLATNKAR